MSRPLIGIYDGQTQETYTREMNDEEYEQYLIDQENFKNVQGVISNGN